MPAASVPGGSQYSSVNTLLEKKGVSDGTAEANKAFSGKGGEEGEELPIGCALS